MSVETRALYYSLRMLWLEDPSIEVLPWQVENYREMSLHLLFSRLRQYRLNFDKESFASLAEECDNPEELTELLIHDREVDDIEYDAIYLLVFELWRRLEKEKLSLSIFCDELDHQIHFYRQERAGHVEELQDILANFKVLLDENVDAGGEPEEVFDRVNAGCANDLEAFLYEYISDQIENPFYASELIDHFEEYVEDKRWFELLKAQLLLDSDTEGAHALLIDLVEEAVEDRDIAFSFELLSIMVHEASHQLFVRLVKETVELIEEEEDFQELISICIDYYSFLDEEKSEKVLQQILDKRPHSCHSNHFDNNDPDVERLLNVLV